MILNRKVSCDIELKNETQQNIPGLTIDLFSNSNQGEPINLKSQRQKGINGNQKLLKENWRDQLLMGSNKRNQNKQEKIICQKNIQRIDKVCTDQTKPIQNFQSPVQEKSKSKIHTQQQSFKKNKSIKSPQSPVQNLDNSLWCSAHKQVYQPKSDEITLNQMINFNSEDLSQIKANLAYKYQHHKPDTQCKEYKILEENQVPDIIDEIAQIFESDNMKLVNNIFVMFAQTYSLDKRFINYKVYKDFLEFLQIDQQLQKQNTDLVFFSCSINNTQVDFLRFCQIQFRLAQLLMPWEKNLYICIQQYFFKYLTPRVIQSELQIKINKAFQELGDQQLFVTKLKSKIDAKTLLKLKEFLIEKDVRVQQNLQDSQGAIKCENVIKFLNKIQICPYKVNKNTINHVLSCVATQPQISVTFDEVLCVIGIIGIIITEQKIGLKFDQEADQQSDIVTNEKKRKEFIFKSLKSISKLITSYFN
eukprot:403342148